MHLHYRYMEMSDIFCFLNMHTWEVWWPHGECGSSSPEGQALAGDTVLCSWARHFTPTVSLSTQVL